MDCKSITRCHLFLQPEQVALTSSLSLMQQAACSPNISKCCDARGVARQYRDLHDGYVYAPFSKKSISYASVYQNSLRSGSYRVESTDIYGQPRASTMCDVGKLQIRRRVRTQSRWNNKKPS